jgi:hypothetical protein
MRGGSEGGVNYYDTCRVVFLGDESGGVVVVLPSGGCWMEFGVLRD